MFHRVVAIGIVCFIASLSLMCKFAIIIRFLHLNIYLHLHASLFTGCWFEEFAICPWERGSLFLAFH